MKSLILIFSISLLSSTSFGNSFSNPNESSCNKKTAVIFDVDDTLVDTNYRTLDILQKAGRDLKIDQLIELEYPRVDFFCSVTVKNTGINDAILLENLCGHFDPDPNKNTLTQSIWGREFYSNPKKLHFDHVMAGAPEFVNRVLEETGAQIIYLTGRNEELLRQGTEEELGYYGFPGFGKSSSKCAKLVMKPKSFLSDDASFKKLIIAKLQQQGILILAAFDDSASNANALRELLPMNVPVIRPNRNVADSSRNKSGIEQITNYYFNAWVDPVSGVREVKSNENQLTNIIQQAVQVVPQLKGPASE